MALSISQTVALGRILKPGMRMASMGYPDLIAPLALLLGMLPRETYAPLEYRADSAAICRRHGLQQRNIPDSVSFFNLLGCKLDVYDIVAERGCEIMCDLNVYLHPERKYDIVLDVGTVEHCFNIGQAIVNMAEMLNIGGIIIHENPFNWPNHGFYNLNPTFFADFYAANGFKLLDCKLVTRDGRSAEVPHTARFKAGVEEVNIFAMAQRVEIKPFVWPLQSKYAKAVPAAGVDRAMEKEHA